MLETLKYRSLKRKDVSWAVRSVSQVKILHTDFICLVYSRGAQPAVVDNNLCSCAYILQLKLWHLCLITTF